MSEKKNKDKVSLIELVEKSGEVLDNGDIELREEDIHRAKEIVKKNLNEMSDEEKAAILEESKKLTEEGKKIVEESKKTMEELSFNYSLFNINGGASAGKRGRKPTVMSRTEWEMFYLNKPVKELVTELVEIKMDGLVTLRREEYEELLKYKREVNVMKQKFESFTSSFLNNSLFASGENGQSLGEFMSEDK